MDLATTERLNRIREVIIRGLNLPPHDTLRLFVNTNVELLGRLPKAHFGVYEKDISELASQTPSFHIGNTGTTVRTDRSKHSVVLDLSAQPTILPMWRGLIKQWKNKNISMPETAVAKDINSTLRIPLLYGLSQEEAVVCKKSLDQFFPQGIELGRAVGLVLYEQRDRSWLRPGEFNDEKRGKTPLMVFPFKDQPSFRRNTEADVPSWQSWNGSL